MARNLRGLYLSQTYTFRALFAVCNEYLLVLPTYNWHDQWFLVLSKVKYLPDNCDSRAHSLQCLIDDNYHHHHNFLGKYIHTKYMYIITYLPYISVSTGIAFFPILGGDVPQQKTLVGPLVPWLLPSLDGECLVKFGRNSSQQCGHCKGIPTTKNARNIEVEKNAWKHSGLETWTKHVCLGIRVCLPSSHLFLDFFLTTCE